MALRTQISKFSTARIAVPSIIAGTVLLMLATPAMAERSGHFGHRGAMMEAIDTDGNGKISREERDAAHAKHFGETDADGDGTISLAEFEAMHERRRAMMIKHRFERLDADKDGKVSQEEMQNRNAMGGGKGLTFEELDADGDGELSRKERRKAHRKMRHHRMHGKDSD